MIDIYHQTPGAMLYLAAVLWAVFAFLWVKVVGWLYKRSNRRIFDETCRRYMCRIQELENKLREYERTHRTMV